MEKVKANPADTHNKGEQTKNTTCREFKTARQKVKVGVDRQNTGINVLRPFGRSYDTETKTTRIHQGVDISLEVGTPIYCPVNGKVMSIHTHKEGGVTLVVQCGSRRFGFCHLSSVTSELKKGSLVSEGQEIAQSGKTGYCDTPHLHLSVKTGGQWEEQGGLYMEEDEFGECRMVTRKARTVYVGGEYVDPTKYLKKIL